MKRAIILSVGLALGLTTRVIVSYADETAKPAGEKPAAIEQQTEVKSADKQQAASPAAETKTEASMDVKETAKPADAAAKKDLTPAAASTPVTNDKSSETPAKPAQVNAAPAASVPVPAAVTEKKPEIKPVGCVVLLGELVSYYDGETANVKKLMQKWDGRMRSSTEKMAALQSEIDNLDKDIVGKKGSDNKSDKKELGRLQKQMERLLRDKKNLKNDMTDQKNELISELKELSRDVLTSMGNKFQKIQENIRNFDKE